MRRVTKNEYRRWLRAAYIYYYGTGESTGMSDYTWDEIARRIVPDDWDELRGKDYTPGHSLFWLPEDKYPHWAKTPARQGKEPT